MADGKVETISARHVLAAAHEGDPLSADIVDAAIGALVVGCINIVNVLNPSRLIIGGGLGLALPSLVQKLDDGIRKVALRTATENLEVLPASLGNDAGAIGAASLLFNN